MKIIYLSGLRLPTKNAHGFQIMSMCSAFAKIGNDVLLLVPWRKNLLKEEPFDFYKLPKTFKIKKLPAIDLYPFRFIPEKISNLLHLFSFLLAARFYLLAISYDALYTRESFTGLFFRKFYLEVHGPEQIKKRGFYPEKFVVLNSYIKKVFVSKGIREENVLIASDAVDLALFPRCSKEEARRRLNWNYNLPTALYCGNFKSWKGVDTVAAAVELLPEVFFVMFGATKDDDLNRIQNQVSGFSNALIGGFRPHEELHWYLSAADILLLPNTAHDENSKFYTSPLKLFEYMASGRPIIASDLPSLREVLNESNCVFFEPDNSVSLVEAIRKILEDPNLAKDVSTQALSDVKEYTWEKRASKIVDFLIT